MSKPQNNASKVTKSPISNKSDVMNQSQTKPNPMENSQQPQSVSNSQNSSNRQPQQFQDPQQQTQTIYPVRPYLEKNLVPIVQQALIELDKVRPDDPLEFVGNYLLSKAQNYK